MLLMRFIRYIFRFPRRIFNRFYNWSIFNIKYVGLAKNWKINGKIYISNQGKISIGSNFKANSAKHANPIGGDTVLRFIVRKGANLTIGNNVGISNSTIACWNKVEIGDYVYIGGSCKIWDTDFHSIDPIERRHKGDNNVKTAPITICDYAFIGGGSIILKGVSIGKNSIVAAGSVVSKDIPDNEIWGGNPAKFIKKIR